MRWCRLDLLQARGLAFDLQCNPHQLLDAAKLFAGYPALTVVVNHLACPKLGRTPAEDDAELATWRTGMAALAANPRVYVKVSMLGYIRAVSGPPRCRKRLHNRRLAHHSSLCCCCR